MNRLDGIEERITNALLYIDPANSTPPYIFKTTTGTVQIYDEALSLALNSDVKEVNYIIEEDDSGIVNDEWQVGQYAYTNKVNYIIKAKVHNIGNEGNPKKAIRSKMHDVLDDLLFLFGNDHTLKGLIAYIKFVDAVKDIDEVSNNRIQSGTLTTTWEIEFTQDIANPSIGACA